MGRRFEDNADRVESDGTGHCFSNNLAWEDIMDLPNHPLELLLLNVVGYFALDITSRQCHCERFRHVSLYSLRDSWILRCRAHPYLCRSSVFKFTRSKLRQVCARY